MKKKFKIIILSLAGALVVAVLAVNFFSPMKVAGIRLKPGDYENVIEEEGELFAQRKWNLYAPQSLVVKDIYVEEGDRVEKGDLLLRLDGEMLSKQVVANENAIELQLTTLRGELASVISQKRQYSPAMVEQTVGVIGVKVLDLEDQLALAKKEYENAKSLFDSGFLSQTALEQAQLAVRGIENTIAELSSSAGLQKEQMNATYEYYSSLESSLTTQIATLERLSALGATDAASAQLLYLSEQTNVFSPAKGTVLRVGAKEGEIASTMAPVVTIYEKGYVGAEVFVLASDALYITQGMACEVVIDGREKRTVPAVVTAVSLSAEQVVSELGLLESRVKVTLSLEGGEDLVIGQKADIRFILESEKGAVAVPKAAVFDYGADGFAVMAERLGKADLIVIEKQFETDTMIVIKSGLSEGDVVLLSPEQEGLKVGTPVSVSFQ